VDIVPVENIDVVPIFPENGSHVIDAHGRYADFLRVDAFLQEIGIDQ
jgi:hypothetical protein